MPMTPEDVKQIIDALEQQDWVQWVKGQMKAQTAQDPPAAGDEAAPSVGAPCVHALRSGPCHRYPSIPRSCSQAAKAAGQPAAAPP